MGTPIIAIGAGERLVTGTSIGIARFFGELSYPLHITHDPLIFLYSGWVFRAKVPVSVGAPVGAMPVTASDAIAYGCFTMDEVPGRRRPF